MLPGATAHCRYAAVPDNIYRRIKNNALCSNFYVAEIGFDEESIYSPSLTNRKPDEYLLFYVAKGRGSYRSKRSLYEMEENDYFVMPVRLVTAIQSFPGETWTIFWAVFAGDHATDVSRYLMGKDFKPKKAKPLVGRVAQFNDILHHMDLMDNVENLVYLNSRFYSFVCSFKLKVLAARIHSKKDRAIHTIEFMRANLDKAITLEQLASRAGLSVSHYCAVFKKRTSQTPMQLFTSMKIQRACQWLLNRNVTIKAIAYSLGFFDQYHFSKVFKEVMGVSPKLYKKQRSAKPAISQIEGY
ncbi:AraC family transcriptional regulator [Chryseolinea sp. T2]|uniref:AraC family transcriptional regulator n=1 Tax=Chryseolinea sp. T2 TaxID=3129255 RepID=UPI003077B7CE